MKLLSFDWETTCKEANNYGHPFDLRNKSVLLSCYDGRQHGNFWFNHTERDHCERGDVTSLFESADYLYVAFNAKFDMHWLRREFGRQFQLGSVWCCQVAEMRLTRQQNKMPSLDDALARYGLQQKLNVVKTEYWDKGIDTDIIPAPIVEEYGSHDSKQTYELALLQIAEAKERGMYNAIRIACCDLIILAEMEWNGMVYDVKKSNELAEQAKSQITNLDASIRSLVCDDAGIVSFDSPANLSAILFGGMVKYSVPYVHVYKNGNSVVRKREEFKEFPRLITPPDEAVIASTEKKGVYSTSLDVFNLLKKRKLNKFQRSLLDLLIERSKIEQLRGTYYEGIPKLFEEMGWTDGIIHHTLNQTVAVTTRLSSSKPNLQNQSTESKQCFISRF
jgi:DNA polymerase I-like protein with 3'-5' exonuclease and polymerase domains